MEKPLPPFALDITKPSERLESFLKMPANDRIVFSGIFGIGKTYFLNKYFNEGEAKRKYITLHLYPTNYSVSKTEDIFELIKYDILYRLFEYNIEFDKLEVSKIEALALLSAPDFYNLLTHFIKIIPTLGKKVATILNPIEKLFSVLSNKQKSLKFNQAEKVNDFAKRIQNQSGIYENDALTNLIHELISKLKGEENREVVLIVDDLDRIDPDHIFRIINIFAVHFDATHQSTNKFGLNRIILSCDINNIRKIFANRYGGDVSFNGYIDKFYSREIFHFDNKEEISNSVKKIISSIKLDGNGYEVLWRNPLTGQRDLLEYILKCLVKSDKLNLRTLEKIYGMEYQYQPQKMSVYSTEVSSHKLPLSPTLDFLIFLFGDVTNLLNALDAVVFSTDVDHSRIEKLITNAAPELIFIACFNIHKFVHERYKNGVTDGQYTVKVEYNVQFNVSFKEAHYIDLPHFKSKLKNAISAYHKLTNGDTL